MAYQQYQDVYPIIVLGDASVGKTCIIQNFSKNTSAFLNYRPTIGIDYISKNIELGSHLVKAQIWDTAGQENYRSVTVDYMRKAHGALVIFDVTNSKTFASVRYWIQTLRERASNQNVQIYLVGNKIDKSQFRVVSSAEAEDLARQYGVSYCQVTASDPSLLATLFTNICRSTKISYQEIQKVKNGEFTKVDAPLRLEEPTSSQLTEKKKGCC